MRPLNFRAKPKKLFLKLTSYDTALLNAAARKLRSLGKAVKEDDLALALLHKALVQVCHEEIEEYKSSLTTMPEK